MALSLVHPTAYQPIGPGYYMQVYQSTVGAIPVDDYLEVTIVVPGTLNYVSTMSVPFGGSHFPIGMMGLRKVKSTLGDFYEPGAAPVPGILGSVAPGGAVDVRLVQRHANNVVVDSYVDTGGWTWDPTGGLGEFIAEALSSDAVLSEILAAVTRSFSSSS